MEPDSVGNLVRDGKKYYIFSRKHWRVSMSIRLNYIIDFIATSQPHNVGINVYYYWIWHCNINRIT